MLMLWDLVIVVIMMSITFGSIMGFIIYYNELKRGIKIRKLEKKEEDFLNPEYAEKCTFLKENRIPIVPNGKKGKNFYKLFLKDEDNFVEVLWDSDRELFAINFGSRTKRRLYSSNNKIVEKINIEDLPRIS